MIDVYELYQEFTSTFNTHQFGFFRPVRDFMPALNDASLEAFKALAGQQGRSQKITDLLRPFLRRVNVVVAQGPAYEYAPYPPDYEFFAAARVVQQKEKTCGLPGCDLFKEGECIPHDQVDLQEFYPSGSVAYEEVPFENVGTGRWAAVTGHVTRGPSLKKPKGTQIADGFQVLPRGIGVVVLDYYRAPKRAVLDYTERPVGADVYLDYNPASSTQLEWSEVMRPYFLYKIGKRYGLTIQNELLLQVTNIDKLLL
jgi:hypothetical protein